MTRWQSHFESVSGSDAAEGTRGIIGDGPPEIGRIIKRHTRGRYCGQKEEFNLAVRGEITEPEDPSENLLHARPDRELDENKRSKN